MRLYLAVAVLMLAIVACTDAEDETMEQKFSAFTAHVAEMGRNLAEKAKTNMQDLQDSKFATSTRDWFQQQIDALRNQLN